MRQVIWHYSDVIMGTMASQITSLTIVYSTVYSAADQWKHQSSASLAFVRGIHRWPVNSPHKWLVTRKMFPFDDVIMIKSHFNMPWETHSITSCVTGLFIFGVFEGAKKRVQSNLYLVNETCGTVGTPAITVGYRSSPLRNLTNAKKDQSSYLKFYRTLI